MLLPKALQTLINELSRLPGIGPKSAQRLGFFLFSRDGFDNNQLALALQSLKEHVRHCSVCFTMTESEVCSVCTDSTRDNSQICVVEEVMDALSLDKAGNYRGKFHVLGGVISPLDGVGPEKLNITQLFDRISKSETKEVILATNMTLEGEATAMYLTKLLRETGVKVTRLARGLPMGSDLEYADEMTLSKALEGRRDV